MPSAIDLIASELESRLIANPCNEPPGIIHSTIERSPARDHAGKLTHHFILETARPSVLLASMKIFHYSTFLCRKPALTTEAVPDNQTSMANQRDRTCKRAPVTPTSRNLPPE
jgi:hypothetical protein